MSSTDEIALREICTQIAGPNAAALAAARTRLDRLAKPPGSLGTLEPLIVRLAAMTGQIRPDFQHPIVLVAAGDHGVVAERISAYSQAATGQTILHFLRGGAAINALAANAGAQVVVVDAGVAAELPDHPRLRRAAAGRGSGNLLREPAMTRAQAAAAMLAGARIVGAEAEAGLDLLALGEIGVGNTTPAACLTSAFTGVAPELTTGRDGAPCDDDSDRTHPIIPQRAAQQSDSGQQCSDHRAGQWKVSDRSAVTSAAFVAVGLAPNLRHFLIAAHRSAEPGHGVALEHLGLDPLLALDLRLGEGCGAALALPIILGAARLMREMATPEHTGTG